MLYNPFINFENKVFSLDMCQFYIQKFLRGGLPHYTNELGVSEGVIYSVNNYAIALLKRLAKAPDIKIRIFGNTLRFDDESQEETNEGKQWVNIEKFYKADRVYDCDYFVGENDDGDKLDMLIDDATHFIILPTQKPTNAVRYQP